MPLRVIAGKAKGRRLKMVPGDSTRPVMDRVKESLFSILGDSVEDSRWLDLFAGTGSIGIEALSRGAASCLLLDFNPQAVRTIRANLETAGLEEGAQVLRADALSYLLRPPSADQGFEFIYIAPPQYQGLWASALQAVDKQPGWLYPDGLAIVQIDPKEDKPLELVHLHLIDERTYGNTRLAFYEKPGE